MNAASQRLTQQGWSQGVSTELIMGTSSIAPCTTDGLWKLCTGSRDGVKPPQRESEGMRRSMTGMLTPGTHLVKSSSPIMCRGMGEYRDGVTWGGMG